MGPYLESSEYIDWQHPAVLAQAQELAGVSCSEEAVALRCYVFVRDFIPHSWDHQKNPVTCRASDVLLHGTGFCYAKSHLLAALLRANSIPAGLCYQRLSVDTAGAPFCLHGLNAVFLKKYGWYRIDPRGNKPGVSAAFTPPIEALAFALTGPEECDLPEIWPEPLPIVIKTLTTMHSIEQVYAHLPDIVLMHRPPHS
jgi:transglutaminase-like putative cysteine protease